MDKSKELITEHKYEEACQELKQALAIEPSCAEIYHLLAQLYEAQGNKIESDLFNTIAERLNN